jgi:hypothetical protein
VSFSFSSSTLRVALSAGDEMSPIQFYAMTKTICQLKR